MMLSLADTATTSANQVILILAIIVGAVATIFPGLFGNRMVIRAAIASARVAEANAAAAQASAAEAVQGIETAKTTAANAAKAALEAARQVLETAKTQNETLAHIKSTGDITHRIVNREHTMLLQALALALRKVASDHPDDDAAQVTAVFA